MRQVIDRLGSILSLFSFDCPEWGVGEIASRLGLAKSTVSELLTSLASQGFVERTRRGRYRLGWRLFTLNQVLLESTPLVRESRREMQELVERHGESSHLMVLERDRAVIVERMQASVAAHLLMYRVGLRLPAHCSSCGKVLLASRPWGEVARMFDDVELQRLTPNTIGDLATLRTEVERVRVTGVAHDREEIVPGLSCVAAPVRDETGAVIAAISISVPTYRISGDEPRYERMIVECAQRISRRLGFVDDGAAARRDPPVRPMPLPQRNTQRSRNA
jgi:DNA-binding IclR family transcriptional regulator